MVSWEVKHGKAKAKKPSSEVDLQPTAPPPDPPPGHDHDDTVRRITTAAPPTDVDGGAQEQQPAEVEEDWSFLCIDVPGSPHSCCCWACTDCAVCDLARGCDSGKAIVIPVATLMCFVSFGRWSSWYSRTLCGKHTPFPCTRVCARIVCVCGGDARVCVVVRVRAGSTFLTKTWA